MPERKLADLYFRGALPKPRNRGLMELLLESPDLRVVCSDRHGDISLYHPYYLRADSTSLAPLIQDLSQARFFLLLSENPFHWSRQKEIREIVGHTAIIGKKTA